MIIICNSFDLGDQCFARFVVNHVVAVSFRQELQGFSHKVWASALPGIRFALRSPRTKKMPSKVRGGGHDHSILQIGRALPEVNVDFHLAGGSRVMMC